MRLWASIVPRSRLDDEITAHLEVKRRTELEAVKGEDAFLVGHDIHRHRLARLDTCRDVVAGDAEPVRGVSGRLHIGDGPLEMVSLLDLNMLGLVMTAQGDHVHFDLV